MPAELDEIDVQPLGGGSERRPAIQVQDVGSQRGMTVRGDGAASAARRNAAPDVQHIRLADGVFDRAIDRQE